MKNAFIFVALLAVASNSQASFNDGMPDSPLASVCSISKYRTEVGKLIVEMNKRTETLIRDKMNSLSKDGVVLGYQENSIRLQAASLHIGRYESYQDNKFSVRSANGDEYLLEYWDIMAGLRYSGNFDIFAIRYNISGSVTDTDINFNPKGCQIVISRETRSLPLMLANMRTKMGYFITEDEAKDSLSITVPLK